MRFSCARLGRGTPSSDLDENRWKMFLEASADVKALQGIQKSQDTPNFRNQHVRTVIDDGLGPNVWIVDSSS